MISPVLSEPELRPEFVGGGLARRAVDVGDAHLGALAQEAMSSIHTRILN